MFNLESEKSNERLRAKKQIEQLESDLEQEKITLQEFNQEKKRIIDELKIEIECLEDSFYNQEWGSD